MNFIFIELPWLNGGTVVINLSHVKMIDPGVKTYINSNTLFEETKEFTRVCLDEGDYVEVAIPYKEFIEKISEYHPVLHFNWRER